MPDTDAPDPEHSELDAADVAAIHKAMSRLQGPAPSAPTVAGQLSPQFPDLESWVNEFFVLTFGRPDSRISWCARWWDHPEAVLRLDALWRTWEVAARDPLAGMAVWLRDHLDPALAVLFAHTGPFGSCTTDQHTRPPVLPVIPPPDDRWSAPQHWWDVLTEPDR